MVKAKFRIVPPSEEWFVQLSTARPEDDFTLQTVYDDETELVGIFEVETDDLPALRRTLESIDRIRSHEVLHADDEFAVVQYTTTESIVYSATIDSGMLPPASVTVKDGVMLAEVTMPHDQLSQTITALEESGASCELRSLSQEVDTEHVLTPSQHEFVVEAVRHGYYDTPRRCTLTELAAAMDVTPAAASTMAHRAEERIVKAHVEHLEADL